MFDFAAVRNKSLILIEYHGKQHYDNAKFFGASPKRAQQQLELVQLRDRTKQQWCDKHSVELLVISYVDHSKINSILTDVFKTKQVAAIKKKYVHGQLK